MKDVKPTIGGDPEFFIYVRKKKESPYQVISADKVLKGKMKKESVSGGSIFFDGVQAEINPRFSSCRESFINNIRGCLFAINQRVQSKYPNHIINFAPIPAIKIKPKDIEGADRECMRFGCAPDSNIYTEEKIDYPDGKKFMTRFSGGHIHLGFSDIKYMKIMKDPEKLYNLVKMFDYIPGIMSTAIFRDETENIRRKFYGQAGTYRIQNHGIEYRALSSSWLSSPYLTSLFTSFMRDSFRFVINGMEEDIFKLISEEEIRETINSGDYKNASRIYKEILLPLYNKKVDLEYGIPLKYKYVRDFVDTLIEKGYNGIFNPFYMNNYWCITKPHLHEYRSTYGIKFFSKDFQHKLFTNKDILTIGD